MKNFNGLFKEEEKKTGTEGTSNDKDLLHITHSSQSEAALIYNNEYIFHPNQSTYSLHQKGRKIKHMQNICTANAKNNHVDKRSSYIYRTTKNKLVIPRLPSLLYETAKQDTAKDDQNKSPEKDKRMDWSDYQRLDVIHAFLDEMENDYPSICTVGVIGKSLEGRLLKILKVSNSDASNAAVWMDAGIHAREWIAPAVATYIANHIIRNFSSLPSSITNKDWYFHPVVNPDGYEYSHTSNRMWRKNKAYHAGKCFGVDLNRNFSYGWGWKGSSDSPKSSFYRGPEPFSEPESCAMRDVLTHSGIPFKVYITLHSYGQIILFPFACKKDLCPDYVRLLEGATIMSKAIHESSGNTYKVGLSRDVLYGAAGTSNDFSYGEAKIPYCYLLELRSKEHKFKLPKEEIEETGDEILSCIKALMEFVDEQSNTGNTK